MTTTTEEKPVEQHAFEADVSRLLHMMVHSVYSDKDVFLRELISNAADACEIHRGKRGAGVEPVPAEPEKETARCGDGQIVGQHRAAAITLEFAPQTRA